MTEERDFLQAVFKRTAKPLGQIARLMEVISEEEDADERDLVEALVNLGHSLHDLGESFLEFIDAYNSKAQFIEDKAEKLSKLSWKDRRWLKQAGIDFGKDK